MFLKFLLIFRYYLESKHPTIHTQVIVRRLIVKILSLNITKMRKWV